MSWDVAFLRMPVLNWYFNVAKIKRALHITVNQLLFAVIIFHIQHEINWFVLAYFRDYDVIICEVLISEPFDDCVKVILEDHMF